MSRYYVSWAEFKGAPRTAPLDFDDGAAADICAIELARQNMWDIRVRGPVGDETEPLCDECHLARDARQRAADLGEKLARAIIEKQQMCYHCPHTPLSIAEVAG